MSRATALRRGDQRRGRHPRTQMQARRPRAPPWGGASSLLPARRVFLAAAAVVAAGHSCIRCGVFIRQLRRGNVVRTLSRILRRGNIVTIAILKGRVREPRAGLTLPTATMARYDTDDAARAPTAASSVPPFRRRRWKESSPREETALPLLVQSRPTTLTRDAHRLLLHDFGQFRRIASLTRTVDRRHL